MSGMSKSKIEAAVVRAEEYVNSAGGRGLLAELSALGDGPLAAQIRAWETRLAAELGVGGRTAGRHVAAAINKVAGGTPATDTNWGGKRR